MPGFFVCPPVDGNENRAEILTQSKEEIADEQGLVNLRARRSVSCSLGLQGFGAMGPHRERSAL
jgi:hypothetical protein